MKSPLLEKRNAFLTAATPPGGDDQVHSSSEAKSAPTLRALLLDNGRVHGMVATAKLPKPQLDDLIAYLETL